MKQEDKAEEKKLIAVHLLHGVTLHGPFNHCQSRRQWGCH